MEMAFYYYGASYVSFFLRIIVFFQVVPQLRTYLPVALQVPVAMGLAIPAYNRLSVGFAFSQLGDLFLREMVFGFLLGAIVGMVLHVLPLLGRLLDLLRGSQIGEQTVPGSGVQVTLFEQLGDFAALAVLFSPAVLSILLSALYYDFYAVGELLDENLPLYFWQLTDAVFVFAICSCFSIIIVSLVFDLTVAISTKALRRINLQAEFLPVKLLFGLIVAAFILQFSALNGQMPPLLGQQLRLAQDSLLSPLSR